jgi:predicted phosphoribosyltransferase
LAIIVVRKLPFPDNSEAGFGAIAEDGSIYFIDRAPGLLPTGTIEQVIKEQKLEIKRRIDVLREGKSLPALKNRTVILVDDGIAMGSTMHASIMLCKNNDAAKIIVAAPVAGPSIAADLAEVVDRVVILEKPPYFRAVAQAYENWYDVPDKEVVLIMQEYERLKRRT